MILKIFWMLVGILWLFPTQAQIRQVDIKLHGLVCSLCTQSVEKAINKLNFVESVHADLDQTTAFVTFKKDIDVSFIELARAVKKAGFSVGSIIIHVNSQGRQLDKNESFLIQEGFMIKNIDQVIYSKEQTLSLQLIGSEYMSQQIFKHWRRKLKIIQPSYENLLLVSLPN